MRRPGPRKIPSLKSFLAMGSRQAPGRSTPVWGPPMLLCHTGGYFGQSSLILQVYLISKSSIDSISILNFLPESIFLLLLIFLPSLLASSSSCEPDCS